MEAEEQTNSDDVESEVKSGWADSMAKILGSNKPKNKKTVVLSRARKDFEIRKTLEPGVESVPVIPIREETESVSPSLPKKSKKEEEIVISVKAQRKLELEQRRKLREWENVNRKTPDLSSPSEKSKERELIKIGTRGVVQLFNAVNLQQKSLKEKLRGAGKSEFKKDKVLNQSRDMFDSSLGRSKHLTDYESESPDDEDVHVKSEDDYSIPETTGSITFKTTSGGHDVKPRRKQSYQRSSKSKPAFPALQDDFMMSAALKDWGKEDGSD